VTIASDPDRSKEERAEAVNHCFNILQELREAEEASGYRVDRLVEAARG
jgi:hypothetical protein